jgi:hypothetical protein
MTETEANIRASLLDTLSFLASETKQREFAAKVFYASYQSEFACWWFDTFYPDESSSLHMFSETQLAILRAFSEAFDRNLTQLGLGELPIEHLLQKHEWQAVVASARAASAQLASAT